MASSSCTIVGCNARVHAKRLCSTHYSRLQRNGDPCRVKHEKGAPLAFLQRALGYEGDECLFWPFAKAGKGYPVLYIGGVRTYAHVQVCKEVHGDPPSNQHEVAHSCGKGNFGCIAKRHLRWATRAENHADKLQHGTDNRGEMHGLAKLTRASVLEIVSQKGKMSQSKLAEKYGVNKTTVARIFSGETWQWLTKPYLNQGDLL